MEQLPHRIRALRRLQGRTLGDVAGRCGFTVSLLSKIESGKTVPPLSTLTKIASALGASVADLLSESREETTVFTSARALRKRPASETDKGYAFHVLAAGRSGKLMQPFLVTARRGEIKKGVLSHSGEEFIYLLEGRMTYRVGSTTYTLAPGDTLYFNAEEDHDLEPISPSVRYLAVFTGRPGKAS